MDVEDIFRKYKIRGKSESAPDLCCTICGIVIVAVFQTILPRFLC